MLDTNTIANTWFYFEYGAPLAFFFLIAIYYWIQSIVDKRKCKKIIKEHKCSDPKPFKYTYGSLDGTTKLQTRCHTCNKILCMEFYE